MPKEILSEVMVQVMSRLSRTEAPLPSGTTAWFANVVTDGGLVASSGLFLGK